VCFTLTVGEFHSLNKKGFECKCILDCEADGDSAAGVNANIVSLDRVDEVELYGMNMKVTTVTLDHYVNNSYRVQVAVRWSLYSIQILK
jgi:hypothetical protein